MRLARFIRPAVATSCAMGTGMFVINKKTQCDDSFDTKTLGALALGVAAGVGMTYVTEIGQRKGESNSHTLNMVQSVIRFSQPATTLRRLSAPSLLRISWTVAQLKLVPPLTSPKTQWCEHTECEDDRP